MAYGFNRLDSDDLLGLLSAIVEDMGLDPSDSLELSEYIAANVYKGEAYESEEALSAAFDETIAPLVIEQYGADDDAAMREAFNDWSDSECRDGRLSFAQYDNYCYVGKYES